MLKLDKKTVLLFLALVGIVAGAVYLLHATSLMQLFVSRRELLAFIEEHRAYAAFIFIGLQVLQVVAAPVPGEVTGFVGGIVFGPFWGIVYSTIGLTIGSWLAFMLARLLGTVLLTLGGSYFRQARYIAFFTVVGVSLAVILIAMIYRDRLERLFRRMQAAQRVKSIAAIRRSRKKTGEAATRNHPPPP